MKSPPVKQNWVTKCIDIHNFHVSQIRAEPAWTVEKTAKALCRSIGSVSQVRGKKREMKSQELEL